MKTSRLICTFFFSFEFQFLVQGQCLSKEASDRLFDHLSVSKVDIDGLTFTSLLDFTVDLVNQITPRSYRLG